jgi:hypothetical protein
MIPIFPPDPLDPDGFAEAVRECVRKNPCDVDRSILILEERFGAGLDHLDVEEEQAEILRRQAEKGRQGRQALRASGLVDPDSGEFSGTEGEAMAILEAAGVFDGWEHDFKAFLMLEYLRLSRQRRN